MAAKISDFEEFFLLGNWRVQMKLSRTFKVSDAKKSDVELVCAFKNKAHFLFQRYPKIWILTDFEDLNFNGFKNFEFQLISKILRIQILAYFINSKFQLISKFNGYCKERTFFQRSHAVTQKYGWSNKLPIQNDTQNKPFLREKSAIQKK